MREPASLFVCAEMEQIMPKTKNAKLMSQCHKSAETLVNTRLSGCDKELRQPCHTMSQCHTFLVTPPSPQEGRGGPRSGEKPPLGGVSYIERSKGVA